MEVVEEKIPLDILEKMKKVTILQTHKNMVEFYSDISIACKYVDIPVFLDGKLQGRKIDFTKQNNYRYVYEAR